MAPQSQVQALPETLAAGLRVLEALRVRVHVEVERVEELQLVPQVHEDPLLEGVVLGDEAKGDGGLLDGDAGLHLGVQLQEDVRVEGAHVKAFLERPRQMHPLMHAGL